MKTLLTTFETMTSDIRGDVNWALIKNMIVDKHRATARYGYRNLTGDSNGITQYVAGKFLGDWVIYGWGRGAGVTTGAWLKLDISSGGWTTPANSEGAVGARYDDIAFHFEGNLYAYGNPGISKCIPGTSFTSNWHSSGAPWTHKAQPVQLGDYAYFAMDNVVYELAPGGLTLSTRYTLPVDTYITSLSADGNTLSVMTYNTGLATSKEWLFNAGATVDTAYDAIEWGGGRVAHHATIRGVVLGIVDERSNQAGDINDGSVKLKRRAGGVIVVDAEIRLSTTVVVSVGTSAKVFEDALHTKILHTTPLGENISGILRYNPDGTWYISHTNEFDANNFAALGFIPYANYWLIAHSSSGNSTQTILMGDATSGTYDGELQTKIINHGDSMLGKSVVGCSVSFEPLVYGAYVKLYFKHVGDTNWTLLNTGTQGSTVGSTRISISNKTAIKNYKEIQFKILAKRATVTGFKEVSAVIKDEPYDTK